MSDSDTAGILHADLDAFYASVEQRDDPSLRGKPVIVGGGVVLAASYEAKARGVRTAMNGRQARALCPNAVVVEPHMEAYSAASAAVFEIFHDTTPLVEGLSIDEAFLDVHGLRRLAGTPRAIAERLRRRVLDEVGLPITVGVARTKFLAKVASGVGKPDGLLVVDPDAELAFLHPLDVRRLWGVGPVTADKLRSRGLHTVGDIAGLPESALVAMLGPATGRHLHSLSHNHDRRTVTTGRRRSSVGSQRALGRGRRSLDELDQVLLSLVERVTERLRAGRRVGRTITVRFRMDDMSRQTRARTLVQPTDRTDEFLAAGRDLLGERWPHLESAGCSLLGISVADLSNADAVQLGLDLDGHDRRSLDHVLDDVRERFGHEAVVRASLMGRDDGRSVPMLPDVAS
ncbi:DNA polymerase IV [Actinospongicola halichondriae]|uniref:DNA polymerase IV n=1 Tax=Actinospongicola halichondriae TaxID=3236844 RepID=UPI003D5266F7